MKPYVINFDNLKANPASEGKSRNKPPSKMEKMVFLYNSICNHENPPKTTKHTNELMDFYKQSI